MDLAEYWGVFNSLLREPGRADFTLAASRLPLVANGKDRDRLGVKMVQVDIATATEVDEPLPELGRHVVRRTTQIWLVRQNLHTVTDDLSDRC